MSAKYLAIAALAAKLRNQVFALSVNAIGIGSKPEKRAVRRFW